MRAATLALLAAAAAASTFAAGARAEEVQQFGGWSLRCENTGPVEKRSCLITITVTTPKSDKRGVAVAIGTAARSTDRRMAFMTPPNADREFGVQFKVDDGIAGRAPFEGCGKDACLTRFDLSDELMKALNRGETLVVAFRLEGGGDVVLAPVPLDGVAAGVKALLARNKG